jgi:tetratricopeptide (TPR) repeat protein
MQDEARQVLESALEMDPGNQAIREKLGLGTPVVVPEPQETAFPQAVPDLAESIPFLDQAAEIPALEATPPPVLEEFMFPASGPEEPAATAPVTEDISFDHPFSVPEGIEEKHEPFTVPEIPEEQPQPFTVPEIPEEKQELFTEEIPPLTEEFAETPRFEAPEEPAEPAPAFSEEIDLSEIWAEAEFYYQQGLFDEARKHYEKIVEYAPDNAQARFRLSEMMKEQEEVQEFSKLVDGLDGLERAASAGETAEEEMAASASDEEAVRLLMQEISQLKQKSEPAKPAKPAVPAQEQPVAGRSRESVPLSRGEDDFFDLGAELNQVGGSLQVGGGRGSAESDDFFDLASELRDELSTVSVPPPSSGANDEQSLDDIFEEFKRGVEQQATREDADTHYNLGVAYKEMGLLDDAISEFILTPEDEAKYVQSRYMLGLCYMEKGDYQDAIQEIQYALSSTAIVGKMARDAIGMSYDLGLAYQGAGDQDSAIGEFQKVHAADPDYRDVSGKIYELQQGTAISLDQLKDDIEKEISSKFLEEGERIEREEKTRKNEKIHG